MVRTRGLVVLVAAVVLAMTASGYGRGTPSGRVITNANQVDRTNIYALSTNAGNLSAVYSNGAGQEVSAYVKGPMALVSVTNGYDLSRWHAVISHTQYAPAGSVAGFSNWITNWGNVSDPLRVRVTNRGVSAGWLATAPYGVGASTGASLDVTSSALVSDIPAMLAIRVSVPMGQSPGDTNRFRVWLNNTAGNGGGGDGWPAGGAIAPSTQDTNNLRDHQVFDFLVIVQGPVLKLTKVVNLTATRPYQELEYTIHVTNSGNAAARGVTVQDVIPLDATNMTNRLWWSSNGGAYVLKTDGADGDSAEYAVVAGGRTAVRGKWLNLPPNAAGSIRFRVKVK